MGIFEEWVSGATSFTWRSTTPANDGAEVEGFTRRCGTPGAPALRVFDGRTLGWREVAFKKDPGCPVCGAG